MSSFVNHQSQMRKVTAPTYIGYVDTVLDALLLFEACNLGILERAKQRPSPSDRARFICSGSVFVWDEGQTGIRRWTDGRRWSSSRPRGNFIIYRELSNGPCRDTTKDVSGGNSASSGEEEYMAMDETMVKKELLAGYATVKHASNITSSIRNPMLIKPPLGGSHPPTVDAPLGSALTSSGCLLPIKPGGLTKRALSLTTRDGRRLHLISYYLPEDVVAGKLRTPSLDPALSNVRIRADIYSQSVRELEHFSESSIPHNPLSPTIPTPPTTTPPTTSNTTTTINTRITFHDNHRQLPATSVSCGSFDRNTDVLENSQLNSHPDLFIYTDRKTSSLPSNSPRQLSTVTSLPPVSTLLQHSVMPASVYHNVPNSDRLQPTPPPNAHKVSPLPSPYDRTSIPPMIARNLHRTEGSETASVASTSASRSYSPYEQHYGSMASNSTYLPTTPPHPMTAESARPSFVDGDTLTHRTDNSNYNNTLSDYQHQHLYHHHQQQQQQHNRPYQSDSTALPSRYHFNEMPSSSGYTPGTRRRAYSTHYPGPAPRIGSGHQQHVAVELGMPECASTIASQRLHLSVNISTDHPSSSLTVTTENAAYRSYASPSLSSSSSSNYPSRPSPKHSMQLDSPRYFPSSSTLSPTDPRYYASATPTTTATGTGTTTMPISEPMTFTKSSSPPKNRYHPYGKPDVFQPASR